jgi:hypothetical protein
MRVSLLYPFHCYTNVAFCRSKPGLSTSKSYLNQYGVLMSAEQFSKTWSSAAIHSLMTALWAPNCAARLWSVWTAFSKAPLRQL